MSGVKLIAEFCDAYFGPAGPAVVEYINHTFPDANVRGKEDCAKAVARLDQAKLTDYLWTLLSKDSEREREEGRRALVKELTGAQVMAMAADVPALRRMRPGDKEHPIDRVLEDGDEVRLGEAVLVARLTPGHTKGCTTWTMVVEEDGVNHDVVIIGSMGSNPGFQFVNNPDNPSIADEYKQGFRVLRSLAPDVPLGSHPAMYGMQDKYERIGGTQNPFIDPDVYWEELNAVEALFLQVLAEQEAAAGR